MNNIDHLKGLETPFYYYDTNVLDETLDLIQRESGRYNYHVHYAIKANSNERLLNRISANGFGADCVSGNEIIASVNANFDPSKIAFAGVGKSDKEINIGLDNDIFCFNSESIPEIEVINELAGLKGKVANIALRINPNVNAKTHKYITTGLEENKFGINFWELEDVLDVITKSANVKLIGLHFHIGSQIMDLDAFKGLCLRVNEIQKWFYSHKIIVEHVNVGGGLGIDYENPEKAMIPDFESYFALFNQFLELRPQQSLHFELGRSVIAQCGSLFTKVLYVKKGAKTDFAIVDAGMTELIRPALYQAVHKVVNVTSDLPEKRYDVVGPICESSDCFAKAIYLPETKRGDIIEIKSAGAYGEVMSSNYNLRDTVKAYYSK